MSRQNNDHIDDAGCVFIAFAVLLFLGWVIS